MRDVDIEVTHDRADITGNNNDETFRARKYNEGNPQDPNDLHHVRMVKLRYKDALKINWYLGLIKQPNEFIIKHLKEKTDPFVLLKEKFDVYRKQGAIGAGKQDARVTDQREIKVSYSNLPKDQR
jgi:hypothetical protein